MPSKVILKPSNQSLASRGLPLHNDAKPRNNVLLHQSSDSDIEKKIDSMNRGLDQCSSLLGVLLKSDGQTKRLKKKVQVVSPTRKSKVGTKQNQTSYNKRLVSSTPVITKENNIPYNKNKKPLDIKVLCKDDMIDSNTVDELIEERDRLKDYLKGVVHQKSKVEIEYKELLKSPADRGDEDNFMITPRKSDNNNKTNEMDRRTSDEILSNEMDRRTPDEILSNELSEKPYEAVDETIEQSSILEGLLKSITEKLSVPEKNTSIVTPSKSSIQTVTSVNHLSSGTHSILKKHRNTNSNDKDLPIKEHKNIINHENNTLSRKCKANILIPVDFDLDAIPLQSNVQITTLTYLMKELHVVLGDQRDLELDRLLIEIDHTIGLLPFTINNLPTNIESEFDNSLELLRLDNCDLRRQVKTTNQQILELKKANHLKHETYLQSSKQHIEKLEMKLTNEEKLKLQLANQVSEVCKVTNELKQENHNLLQLLSEKDVSHLEERQAWLKEKSNLTKELTNYQEQLDEVTLSIQALRKEKNILEISLRQRDTEIVRLSSLNSDLQNSISTLLADIEMEHQKQTKYGTYRQQNFSPHPSNIPKNIVHKTKRSNQRKFERMLRDPLCSPVMEIETGNKVASVNLSQKSLSLCSYTDSSLSTLRTFDNIDFQNDLIHLDTKIDVVQNAIKKKERDYC